MDINGLVSLIWTSSGLDIYISNTLIANFFAKVIKWDDPFYCPHTQIFLLAAHHITLHFAPCHWLLLAIAHRNRQTTHRRKTLASRLLGSQHQTIR